MTLSCLYMYYIAVTSSIQADSISNMFTKTRDYAQTDKTLPASEICKNIIIVIVHISFVHCQHKPYS